MLVILNTKRLIVRIGLTFKLLFLYSLKLFSLQQIKQPSRIMFVVLYQVNSIDIKLEHCFIRPGKQLPHALDVIVSCCPREASKVFGDVGQRFQTRRHSNITAEKSGSNRKISYELEVRSIRTILAFSELSGKSPQCRQEGTSTRT